METDYTHITAILDRSGSMGSIRHAVINGFNTFLDGQRDKTGRATMTLVQFDSEDPFEVLYRCKDIKIVPHLSTATYVPRACTPLLDAMGHGMVELDEYIAGLDEAARPEHVVFVVITDGLENASREYSRARISRMIDERKERGWQFVYLSADIEAVEEAGSLGFAEDSRMAFDRTEMGVHFALDSLSQRLGRVRDRGAERVEFDDADRGRQDAERKRREGK